ncbi:MAG: rRNA pseudouridine synthase [Clostridium sp.]|nr:rRNA pseudouridine synthase [Clostridium sp.]MCM1444229.1 rRNA pseudouridine synthase [Candidatus Amulumruptor caecigallinarius]
MERLQKAIANSGYCSRRKAEELILNRKVMVNGNIITEMGVKVNGNDIITVDGNTISNSDKEYFLLYKPRGVITSTNDDKNRKTVVDLINTNKRIYPVGRLDYDTSGILLLTNDGNLTNLLIHPRNNIDKVYIAKLNGIITKQQMIILEKGVIIDGKRTSPAKVKLKKINKENSTCIVEITIHEGKNHQVKNMFNEIGHEVIKLKREKFSFLDLSGLKPGEYRTLTIKEVKKLYNEANKNPK